MGSRHGDSFWEEEKTNIGLKLMQGMGWEMGSGLGRTGLGSTTLVKVKRRKGMEGLGTAKDAGRDEMWTAATSAYNDLLKRLASGAPAAPAAATTTTATILQHKSRQQLYSRFKKSNRSYSDKDCEQIFGRKEVELKKVTWPAPSTMMLAEMTSFVASGRSGLGFVSSGTNHGSDQPEKKAKKRQLETDKLAVTEEKSDKKKRRRKDNEDKKKRRTKETENKTKRKTETEDKKKRKKTEDKKKRKTETEEKKTEKEEKKKKKTEKEEKKKRTVKKESRKKKSEV